MNKFFGNKWAIAIFIAPALTLFTVFMFIPIVQVFIYSFSEWNGIAAPVFNGLTNYTKLFNDRVFATAHRNQFIFAVFITTFQMLLATVLAITISNKKVRGRKFLRVSYFIPVVLSVTVVCQLWVSIFSDTGLFNQLMQVMGIDFKQSWLGDRYKSVYVIAFVNAWQWMGYQFALIVAGIKSIGEDFYEAAEIDGATSLKAHWYITLPLLKDTFNFCLLISVTGGIKAFSEIDIMTKGGPGTSTNTLTYIMYTHAFKRQNFGYGLTAAAVLVLECLAIILVLNWLMKDRETPLFARRKGVDLV